MDTKILSLHTGYVKDAAKKLIDVRSVFNLKSFPSEPDFSVGASIFFTEKSPEFTVRFDIIKENGEKLNESIFEIDPLIYSYYKNENALILDIWLMPTGHIIPTPGTYYVMAKIIVDKETVLDEMKSTVIISSGWEVFNPWVM